MSKDPCFDAIRAMAGDDVKDSEIKKAIEYMRDVKGVDEGNLLSFQQKAVQRIRDVREILDRQRKEAAENLLKVRERLDFYDQPAFKQDPAEGVKAQLSKTSFRSEGGNKSVELQAKSLFSRFANNFISSLQKDGIFDAVVKKRLFLEDTYVELDALQRGTPRGTTRNDIAQKAALAIHGVQQDILNLRRNAGFTMKEAEGWIIKRTHDPEKILKAGFDQWYSDIRPMLDEKKMFPDGFKGEDQMKELLQDAFNNITTGKRGSVGVPGVSDELMKLTQIPANLNKLRNQSRVFQFTDPKDEFKYNEAYGRGDLLNTMYFQMKQAGKDIALVNVYGTNPGASFEADLQRLGISNNGTVRQLRNLWDEVNGITSIPGKSVMARTGAAVRALRSMTDLGAATLTTIGEVPLQAVSLKSATGKNILQATGELIAGQARAMLPSIQKEWAMRTGQLIDDSLGELHLAFGAGEDSSPGLISKAQRIYHKLNLLDQRTFASRAAVAKQYAVEFGKIANQSFENIDSRAQVQLKRYGVDSGLWDIVRQGTEDLDGSPAITLDAIEKMPNEKFSAYAKENNMSEDRAKLNAYLSMSSMYTDVAMLGTHTGMARERSRIIYGTSEDSAMGQILRFAYQYKGAPMSVWDTFSRVLFNTAPEDMTGVAKTILAGKGDMLSTAQLMVGMTMAGYMTLTLKDLFLGKTPQGLGDLTKPEDLKASAKLLAKSMVRSGAMGLYGDLLFGEYAKGYETLTANIMGPMAGKADEAMKLFSKAREGDVKKGELLNFAIGNTPGANLFYLRGAMNYLFLYQLQETLSPGFARRAEQRARQNPGLFEDRQRYFIQPTEAVR